MGTISGIYIADEAGSPMQPLTTADAEPGRGLVGDRYYTKRGHWSGMKRPLGQLTIIEEEEIEHVAEQIGMPIDPAEMRRNITTRGIRLPQLIGKRFMIGEVVCRGLTPDAPCRYLQQLIDKPVQRPMLGRAGVRVAIETKGTIRIGDKIHILGDADELLERPTVDVPESGEWPFDFAQWAHDDTSWWFHERIGADGMVMIVLHDMTCPCCVDALVTFDEVSSTRPDVEAVALSPQPVRDNARAAEAMGLTNVRVLYDPDSWTATDLGRWNTTPLPAVFAVNRERVIKKTWTGEAFQPDSLRVVLNDAFASIGTSPKEGNRP